VRREAPLPPFDVHVPLMSVPGILQVDLASIPTRVPYLAADPADVDRWQATLADRQGLRVGIAWQGNPRYRWDRLRSIPVAQFAPLFQVPGTSWVSLQKGPGADQLAAIAGQFDVLDLGPRLGDFADTAAVMRHLDLVIACDSAVAHLAGALGVAAWTLLPLGPDWRWLLDRDDSPWYPTARLFRQTALLDWAGVVVRMREAMQSRLEAAPGRSS
jgi:hypothetical protein